LGKQQKTVPQKATKQQKPGFRSGERRESNSMKSAVDHHHMSPVDSGWDEDRMLELLKYVLDHQELPAGLKEEEKVALGSRLIYVRKSPDGHSLVEISLLGEMFFCDLIYRKNEKN